MHNKSLCTMTISLQKILQKNFWRLSEELRNWNRKLRKMKLMQYIDTQASER